VIGVLGGTFDPIHYGHLRPAQEAIASLGLAELRLMPAYAPPHRAMPVASPAQRLRMVELAIDGLPGLITDDRELRRGGPSYTVLALQELRAELGIAPLCLLIGTDQLRGFERWFHWQEIPRLAHLAVLERPGVAAGDWPGWVREIETGDLAELHRQPAGRLAFLAVSPQDISSTGIRERLACGESVAGLVPDAVRDTQGPERCQGAGHPGPERHGDYRFHRLHDRGDRHLQPPRADPGRQGLRAHA
jgi:nicotinate-nucleotide adenylyltransferase